jgi:hypothetical protein
MDITQFSENDIGRMVEVVPEDGSIYMAKIMSVLPDCIEIMTATGALIFVAPKNLR